MAPDLRGLIELGVLIDQIVAAEASTVAVPAQGQRPARTADVTIRYRPLRMPPPVIANAWIREHCPEQPLLMWVVELKEEHPPAEVEALNWIVLTSEPVQTLADAERVLEYYRLRWGVEEYHQALKTGCRVEKRYYETAARLERVTGLLAVLAVRLLQIRHLATTAPDTPTADVIPQPWITALAHVRKKRPEQLTLYEFVRMLGGLGGHLGRKRDGHPSWITLWRGLEKLHLILRGMDIQT